MSAEFTGERVIPGLVDAFLWNEHLSRNPFAARRKRVLDLGCGAGYGNAELAQTAREATGIDGSAEAVEYAQEHYGRPKVRYEVGSATEMPLADASFDWVVASEELSHNGHAPARQDGRVPCPLVPRRSGLCAFEELAHNGLAPARQDGRVPRSLVPRLRGLCASEELSHNGLAPARHDGRVPRPLKPCPHGLCAFEVIEHWENWQQLLTEARRVLVTSRLGAKETVPHER